MRVCFTLEFLALYIIYTNYVTNVPDNLVIFADNTIVFSPNTKQECAAYVAQIVELLEDQLQANS